MRVAVVQLAFTPAVPEALEDPLFHLRRSRSALLPANLQAPPPSLLARYEELERRIRAAYVAQVARRLEIVLAQCRTWGVRIVVFPEYSVPVEALDRVAAASGEMVVVAGTHFVDLKSMDSGVYDRLGGITKPALRNAVCPVFHGGRLMDLVTKIHPVEEERRLNMEPGRVWRSLDMAPAGIEGPMGVLICRDFMQREDESHRSLIASDLERCRIVAVPSLTPKHTVEEFDSLSWQSVRRYGRPVLYANHAPGGGTSVYGDEGRQMDLREFPERVGCLDPGEEGVIVSDVDLGYDAAGKSTRFGDLLPIQPFAAATFVYRGYDRDYAKWLDHLDEHLHAPDEDEAGKLRRIRQFVEEHPPPLALTDGARRRRQERLLYEIRSPRGIKRIEQLTREVILPEDVLPLDALQAALARGAADEIRTWFTEGEGDRERAQFADVEAALRAAAERITRKLPSPSAGSLRAASEIQTAARGAPPRPSPQALLVQIERYDQALEPRLEEEKAAAGRFFQQGRYEDARQRYQKLAEDAEQLATDDAQLPGDASKRRLAMASRLNAAACSLNLAQHEAARAQLPHIDPVLLSPGGRLRLVEILAALGEFDQAKALLAEQCGNGLAPTDAAAVRQILEITEGRLPDGLSARAEIQVRAALLLLSRNDLAAAAERACFALGEAEKKNDLVAAHAVLALTEALRRTIHEDPPTASFIPEEQRERVLEVIQAEIGRLRAIDVPPDLRAELTQCERGLVTLVRDLDTYLHMQGSPPAPGHATARGTQDDYDRAASGDIEEALRALPQDDHPWWSRLQRVEFLRGARLFDRALAESLDLVQAYPGRALIEYEAAWILVLVGRWDEALPHAEAAFRALPGIGQRLLLADVLLGLGRARDVWDLLQPHAGSEGPRVIFALARAADVVAPSLAVELWRKYVALRPDDARSRVHLAGLLFAVQRSHEAADVAWRAFEEHRDRLDLDALYQCAMLQRVGDLSDAQQVERMTIVMRCIRDRFPTDPDAELLRLQIRHAAGITEPAPEDRIDIQLLERSPHVFRGEGIDQLRELIQERRAIADGVSTLARAGALPIATACAVNNLPLPQLIRRILARKRTGSGFLCPPVGVLDEPPILDLTGQHLLVSYLELLLLDVLGLVEPLRHALGDGGRLSLFRRVLGRIASDAARFREGDAPRRLRQQEDLLRSLRAAPVLHLNSQDPSFDDAALARGANLPLVTSEQIADIQRIQPHALIRHLHEEGYIDQDAQKRLMERLVDHESLASVLDSIPGRFLVPPPFLHALFQCGALDEFLEAFQGRVVISPGTLRFFEDQRNSLAEEIEAGELAESVHRWIGDGIDAWIHILPDPGAVDLPPPLAPENELTRSLLTEPFGEMLAYRRTMMDCPELRLLTADAYMIHAFGDFRVISSFVWRDASEVQLFEAWIRATAGRELYFPALIRLLISDERVRDAKLAILAELGFGDALGAREILRIERRFRGLDKPEPARLLGHQEWLAQSIHRGVGDVARLRLAAVYATAIFQAWCGRVDGSPASEEMLRSAPDRSTAEQEAITRTLLERLERVARITSTNTLDLGLHRIAIETGSQWQSLWRRDGDNVLPVEDTPVKRMWTFLSDWAGADGSRAGAYDRAMREIWVMLDRVQPTGPTLGQGETLLRTIPLEGPSQSPVSFIDPVKETVAILSCFWEHPLLANRGVTLKLAHGPHVVDYAHLLAHGATIAGGSTGDRIRGSEHVLEYAVPIPGGAFPLGVRAPVEAILLRARPDIRVAMAGHWKRLQGRLDGEAYALLDAIERAPADSELLRRLGRRAVTSPWRLVRDDPAFLSLWPQTLVFTGGWESPSLDDLRCVLSEPAGEDWQGASSIREILRARVEGGAWSTRADRWELAEMASEVPGHLPLGIVASQLDDEQNYPERVNEALWQLDHPDEVPAARLARAVLFLRVAAARRPVVSRPEGSVHLGEVLPERLERVLERVSAPPAPDTLAAYEAALLQVSAAVVQRLAYPQALPLREGLWLTYRLFQWLCLQLEALAPNARYDGMKRLAVTAPQPPPEPVDRLDPFGFGRDRFDHRLAAVLHALGVMDVIARTGPGKPTGKSERPQSVSSRGLEERLRAIAERNAEDRDLQDSLGWEAPQSIPDLALLALLRLNLMSFGDLSAEARLRRFETLPLEPDPPAPQAADKITSGLADAIVHASALCASRLGAGERAALMERLRAMKAGPNCRRWRWVAYTGLFVAGEVHLDPEVQSLSVDHVEDATWPLFAGMYLIAVAAHDSARLLPVVDTLVAGVAARGADPVPIALALGHVCIHAGPPAQDVAREALTTLASRAPFCEDPRVAELVSFLDLRGGDHVA